MLKKVNASKIRLVISQAGICQLDCADRLGKSVAGVRLEEVYFRLPGFCKHQAGENMGGGGGYSLVSFVLSIFMHLSKSSKNVSTFWV